MIRKAFLPAISALTLLLAAPQRPCPDDYAPASFEEAEDELAELLEEYFTDTNLSLPPTTAQEARLGLRPAGPGLLEIPGSTIRSGPRRYPIRPGLWRIESPGGALRILHLLIAEPQRLTENEAFNTFNDRLGDLFADYDNPAYGMILLPEELRRRWRGHYLGIGVRIYGLADDATGLPRTVGDVILTDYTAWVRRYRQCTGGKR